MPDTLSLNEWTKYRDILKGISQHAADEFRDAVFNVKGRFKGVGLKNIPRQDLIDYAYELIKIYGDAASAAACIAYDEMAALSGVAVQPAMPAPRAEYAEVAKNINGVLKISENPDLLAGVIDRLVKQASQDTTLQNAIRDGAECAWIPAGDTCAFCIALAGKGWVEASDNLVKNGHAEHIHANCDCAYAVRFSPTTKIQGYDPEVYARFYDSMPGGTADEKVNAMRRRFYDINKEKINEQKRGAYAKRVERESSVAEEMDVENG